MFGAEHVLFLCRKGKIMANSYMKYSFMGWIHSVSDVQITKNGLKFKTLRVTENKRYWLMFMFESDIANLDCVQQGDFVKVDGVIFKDEQHKEWFNIKKIKVMNKKSMVSDEPSIDEDISEAYAISEK